MANQDKYDLAVSKLVRSTGQELWDRWGYARPPFQFCEAIRDAPRPGGGSCGCLTQVREGIAPAWTDALTEEIAADDRLPMTIEELVHKWDGMDEPSRRAALDPFVEWQRRLDREIRQLPAALAR